MTIVANGARAGCLLLLIVCLHNEHIINAHTRNSRSSHTHALDYTGKFRPSEMRHDLCLFLLRRPSHARAPPNLTGTGKGSLVTGIPDPVYCPTVSTVRSVTPARVYDYTFRLTCTGRKTNLSHWHRRQHA